MSEKPILFSTEMVKAIYDDRKTKTRRVIKFKFLPGFNPEWSGYRPVFEYGKFFLDGSNHRTATTEVKCPWQVGDILWVRETWQSFFPEEVTSNHQQGPRSFSGIPAESAKGHYMHFYYRADGEIEKAGWLPSIHMPRAAARLFLKVTNVRVERLQDITEEDAKDEGVKDPYDYQRSDYYEQPCMGGLGINQSAFAGLWDSLYTKRGYGWDVNPWVWVMEFERMEAKS